MSDTAAADQLNNVECVFIGEPLAGRLLMLDARNMEWTGIGIRRNAQCLVCHPPKSP